MGDVDAGGRELTGEIGALHSHISKLEQISGKSLAHKSADDELDKAWLEWEATFDATKDAILITDNEFRIVQANHATTQLFNKSLDQIIGKTCWQLLHGTNHPPKECPLKRATITKKHEEIELYLPEKGIWVEALVSPVLDREGNVNSAVHILRDITDRKKAEEALRESEQKFRTIFDNTSDGMFLFDLEAKKFSMCNKAWLKMLGYTQEEFMNLAIEDLHPKEDLPFIYLQIEEFAKGRKGIRNDIRFKRKDRSIFFTDMSPDLITLDGKRHILVAIKDITERRRSEELLRKERDRAQKYLDVAGVMFVAIDAEQRVGLINKKGCQILGYKEEEVIAKNWFDNFVPAKNREEVRAVFEGLLRGEVEALEYYENPILTKNGDQRLIAWHNTILRDAQGRVIAVLSSGEDITERKKAGEALRKSEHEKSLILDNASEIIAYHDTNHNILWANRAYLKATGLSLSQIKGKKCYHAWRLDGLCKDCPVTKTMETGEPQSAELTPQNQPHWPPNRGSWLSRAAPVKDKTGSIIGAIEVAYDITERKQAEQRLLEDQAQLKSLASQLTLAEEQERRRLAMELHDRISQALVISKIKLDAIRKTGRSRKLDKALEDVCNCLGQTIQDTRTLTFDLSNPVLYELGFETAVSEWLTEQIQKKHGLTVGFEDDGKTKPLDDDVRILLFRDVRELLINVVKHAGAHKVKVSVKKLDDHISVTVEDDGVGFDPVEVLSGAARRGEFGLFSIRERLEDLGGHLQIDSAPGRGCKVTITAPLKQKEMTK